MKMKTKLLGLVLLFIGLLLQNCSSDTSDPEQTARVQVKLVDLPGDYLEVNVNIVDVMYHISNNEDEESWTSFDSFEGAQLIDLTGLTGGVNLVLADEALPAGNLSQIRLVLNDDGNTIVVEEEIEGEGTLYPLETPSAQQSGLKIKVNTELEGGFSYNFILDWDVQKSIVETGNGKYQLKPVIRAEVEANSGSIKGLVFGDLSDDNIDTPIALENVVLSIYNTPLDLSQEPVSTTTSNDEGEFWFTGLKPGTYAVVIIRDGFNQFVTDGITVDKGIVNDIGVLTLIPTD